MAVRLWTIQGCWDGDTTIRNPFGGLATSAKGLTGYGGIPLAGNDSSGDYVVSFTVNDPTAPDDPLNRTDQGAELDSEALQDLGVLFPRELESGVTVAGTLAASATSITYTIQLLEFQNYQFTLTSPPAFPGDPGVPLDNLLMTVTDTMGATIIPLSPDDPNTFFTGLLPGTCTIQISWATPDTSGSGSYAIQITMLNVPENPPPLSIGATPVLQIRLASNAPPAPTTGSGQTPAPSGGGQIPTLPALNQELNPVVRADPGGGITSVAPGSSLAFSAPAQVRGLTNVPTAVAGGAPIFDATGLVVLLVTPLTAPVGPPPAAAPPPQDGITASWFGWVNSMSRLVGSLPRLESLSTSDPLPDSQETMPVPPEVIPTPPVSRLPTELPGNPGAIAEVIPLAQEGVGSGPSLTLQTEGTPAAQRVDNPESQVTNEAERVRVHWLGAMFGAALATFLIWKRTFHAPEIPEPLRQRKSKEQERILRLDR